MMGFASLSISFWKYALKSTRYILNKILSKFVSKIPYEIWIGRKLVLSYLKIWGCSIYVKYLKIDNLGQMSDKYLFIGYPKETRGYYFNLADE